jgi:phosphoglycerate dehydrogenase-like enzyme
MCGHYKKSDFHLSREISKPKWTYEKEPLDAQNPLLKMENVILSPHVGFYSEESISELKRRTAQNISAVLMGRWPGSAVNREVRGKNRALLSI